MVGGLNARQETVLPAHRVDMENYPKGAKANLRPGDAVVIEATTNTWTLYDVTLPYVSKVVVSYPLDVKQIAIARVKISGKGNLDTKKGIIKVRDWRNYTQVKTNIGQPESADCSGNVPRR